MNREDIIRMAREADIDPHDMCEDPRIAENNLVNFAALITANTKVFCPVCNQRDAVRAKFDEESG